MIDTVTGWCEILHYDDKGAINIAGLFETTLLPRYPRTIEITYNHRK